MVNHINYLCNKYNLNRKLSSYGENNIFTLYKKIGFEQMVNLIEDNEHYLYTDSENLEDKENAMSTFMDKIEEGGNKLYKKQNYKEGVGNLSAYFVGIVKNRTEDWKEWEVSSDLINLLKPLDKDNKIELLKQKLIPHAKEIQQGSSYQGSYMYIEEICNKEIEKLRNR